MDIREDYQQPYIIALNLQFFADDGQGGEKTEPATQKKLDDALEAEISKAIEEFKETVTYKMA